MLTMGVLNDASNIIYSASVASFLTTSLTFVEVTNLGVTIIASGKRPILIGMVPPAGPGLAMGVRHAFTTGSNNLCGSNVRVQRDGLSGPVIGEWFDFSELDGAVSQHYNSSSLYCIDEAPAKGSYIYRINLQAVGGSGSPHATIFNARIFAMEI